jgi:hypothetical protein
MKRFDSDRTAREMLRALTSDRESATSAVRETRRLLAQVTYGVTVDLAQLADRTTSLPIRYREARKALITSLAAFIATEIS